MLEREAGCPWMDSPSPAFARALSHSSPGWHTGSQLSYFLIPYPLREWWDPNPQPYHSGSHWVPRGAQKSYTPRSPSVCLQMGQPERSCLSTSLNRNRTRIVHSSVSPIPTQYSLRHTSDHFALSPPFPSSNPWGEDETTVSPYSSMSPLHLTVGELFKSFWDVKCD